MEKFSPEVSTLAENPVESEQLEQNAGQASESEFSDSGSLELDLNEGQQNSPKGPEVEKEEDDKEVQFNLLY